MGLCSLAAGCAIGVAGDIGVRCVAQQDRLYIPMVIVLIFSEVLGIYGAIIAFTLLSQANANAC